MDKSGLIRISRQHIQNALNGDFETIVTNMNSEAATQINASTLAESWLAMTKELEYKGILSADYVEVQGVDCVIILLDYSKIALRVGFRFDKDDRISSIAATYAPLPSAETESQQFDKYFGMPVQIGDPKYPLDGRLLLPKSSADVPVVILVHGSGSSDMNETIGGAENTPFADLALGLAEHGIASIRYNKRYYQYPQTATPTLTVWDEVIKDVNAAIALAREIAGIDKNRIFIIGHSLGGMLAPQIAKENQDIAGFVSLAGSPRKLEDIILDQNKAAISALKNPEADKQAVLENIVKLVNQVKNLTRESPHETIFTMNSEYWLSLNETNPQTFVNKLTSPMLFLQGAEDFQVSPEADFALWQTLLNGNENAQFKLYPGLNHLFMRSSGKKDLSEYNTKAHIEEQVIEDIANWIKSIENPILNNGVEKKPQGYLKSTACERLGTFSGVNDPKRVI